MNKRKILIYILSVLIMTSAFASTYFIKLNGTGWGDTTLFEVLSFILFPCLISKKIAVLSNRFADWLIQTKE